MFVSVILSTYNSPEWLSKVVWGYAVQTHRQFELVIADDGSDDHTAARIEELRRATGLSMRHLWQPDEGFGKCRILNRAIASAAGDYLVFSDGDCVPRSDFLAQHVRLARAGRFLSGGTVRLPAELSKAITLDAITSGRAASPRWLLNHGLPVTRKLRLLLTRGRLAACCDALLTTRATFNGHNSSAWRTDVFGVNGFDERMGYGGLDRELGQRLVNAGVRPRQVRHRAVCLHLDHSRDYVDADAMARNQAIRAETRDLRITWTPYGIRQGAQLLRVVGADSPSPRTGARSAASRTRLAA